MKNNDAGFQSLAEHFEERLKGQLITLGNYHPDTINTRASLGEMYRMLRKHAKAVEILEELYKGFPEVTEELKMGYELTLNNLGAAYNGARQYQKALEVHEKLEECILNNRGVANKELSSCRFNMAVSYEGLNEFEKARQLYEYVLDWCTQNEQDDPLSIGQTTLDLARVYYKLNSIDKARELFKSAHVIFSKELGRNHEATLEIKRWLDYL